MPDHEQLTHILWVCFLLTLRRTRTIYLVRINLPLITTVNVSQSFSCVRLLVKCTVSSVIKSFNNPVGRSILTKYKRGHRLREAKWLFHGHIAGGGCSWILTQASLRSMHAVGILARRQAAFRYYFPSLSWKYSGSSGGGLHDGSSVPTGAH